jgi:hypothetical protein
MEPVATLADLERRLDWALDDDEKRLAVSALEDASDLAREYGRDWTPETVPRLARTLVLAACVRYLRNPDGYTTSRAGDETLTWGAQGEQAGTVRFTEPEIALLRGLGGKRPAVYSVPITAWGPQRPRPTRPVPVEGGQKPFPYFAEEADPW